MTMQDALSELNVRSSGSNASSTREILLALMKANTRVLEVADTQITLLSSNGTVDTIAIYEIDLSAGDVIIAGNKGNVAVLDDQDLILQDILSYQLDGTPAVVLTADGQTYAVAVCVVDLAGVLTPIVVFGAEAADAAEVEPTEAQCYAAIDAADPAGWVKGSVGIIVSRIVIQRTAVDTMVLTHTVASVDERVTASVLAAGA